MAVRSSFSVLPSRLASPPHAIWALWIFGDNVELRLGWPLYLTLFLVSGLAGVIANVGVNPDSILPTIGPGGAVAGGLVEL